MAKVSNADLWNYLRETTPNFANHTAKATKDFFSANGFEALKANDLTALNEFFSLSMRVSLQKVKVSDAKNPLERSGLVEQYEEALGGVIQRMAVNALKPLSPKFKGLQDGDSIDPFKIRKGSADELFWTYNYDFYNLVTLQEYQMKQIFIAKYGMSEFQSGIISQLGKSYKVQKYTNTLEALNTGLNSTAYPLKDTQQIVLDNSVLKASSFETEVKGLEELLLDLKDLGTMMEVTPRTSALNATDFETSYDANEFVVLMRAGIKNRIQLNVEAGTFHLESLSTPFDGSITEVDNFGGLKPYSGTAENPTYLQEVYDSNGAVVGYIDASVTVNGPAFKSGNQWLVNVTSGGTTADTTFPAEPDGWEDPNKDIVAIVAQKGYLFETMQNPLAVNPIFNPAGLYINYHMTQANNQIGVDPRYAIITISEPAA